MSDFFKAVYELVAEIPAGCVVSYSQLARALGKPRGARLVGSAMRSAPGDRRLPCHRVVNQRGEMSPVHVFGDTSLQRDMLESEGVVFRLDGTVDMEKCQWRGF